jgi:hypothetical protein
MLNKQSFYLEKYPPRYHCLSVPKAKPLEHIYHNPILKPSYKIHSHRSSSPKSPSIKVLDLQLETSVMPKLFKRYFLNHPKPIHSPKKAPRSISILPELYINRSTMPDLSPL